MIATRQTPSGAFLLRAMLGTASVAHAAILKYVEVSVPGATVLLRGGGLPMWVAYATFWTEAIGGCLLVAGIWPRAVTVALIAVLLGTVGTPIGGGWDDGWALMDCGLALAAVALLAADGVTPLGMLPVRRWRAA